MALFDIEAIKQKSPIVDVARELGFEVKNNRTRCFFPQKHQHGDRTPSLSFNTRKNTFRCWVCKDVHGDVVDFVRMARGWKIRKSLEQLANRSSIRPTIQPASANPEKAEITPGEFLEVDQYFLGLLSDLTPAMNDWLDNRGGLARVACEYGARSLCEANKVVEALTAKYSLERLQRAGYFNAKGTFIFWRHRLIWVWKKNGLPVYFQGRIIVGDAGPKELCLARPIPSLFNVDCLQSKPAEVFICEGIVDALSLLKYGKAAVAVVGVSGFKESFIPLFQGFRVKVAFDADAAGQAKGSELVQRLRNHGIEAFRIYLPESYDVNQYFQVLRQFGM